MQDFFFFGIISAIALGVFLIKSILFVIHMINLKHSNEIIKRNLERNKILNQQTQQIQSTMSANDIVANWKTDDPRLTEDLRQQFLTKTKTRRTTPTSGGTVSSRERVPLATADFGDGIDDDDNNLEDLVPIYTYNPSIGGTQV